MAQQAIQIDARIADLEAAKVKEVLELDGPNRAREFMRANQIHSPAASTLIDHIESTEKAKIGKSAQSVSF